MPGTRRPLLIPARQLTAGLHPGAGERQLVGGLAFREVGSRCRCQNHAEADISRRTRVIDVTPVKSKTTCSVLVGPATKDIDVRGFWSLWVGEVARIQVAIIIRAQLPNIAHHI